MKPNNCWGTRKIATLLVMFVLFVGMLTVYSEPNAKSSSNVSSHRMKVKGEYIFNVAGDKVNKAITLLENSDCVEISSKVASQLVGYKVKHEKNSKLFIVKALVDHTDATIEAYWQNKRLTIVSLSLGAAGPLEQIPIVISLPEKPDYIFVRRIGMQ